MSSNVAAAAACGDAGCGDGRRLGGGLTSKCLCCQARRKVFDIARAGQAPLPLQERLRACACDRQSCAPFVGHGVPDWFKQVALEEGFCKCSSTPSITTTASSASLAGDNRDDGVSHIISTTPLAEDPQMLLLPAPTDQASTPVHAQRASEQAAGGVTAAASETATPLKGGPCPLGPREKSRVLEDLRGRRVYLFLDYDGTLTPIVSDPTQAFLPQRMRHLLENLAPSCAKVTIVTGRGLKSLRQLTKITEGDAGSLPLLFAASHGFHIEAASGDRVRHQVGAQHIPLLRQAAVVVGRALAGIEGIFLEDNDFAVSVHFRNCPFVWAEEAVEAAVNAVLAPCSCLRSTAGKAVRELRVNVRWDKGRAVAWLLRSMGVDPVTNTDARVIYLGDDLTDEDAFRFLRLLPRSCGILVKDAETPLKRQSLAHFSIDGTVGVENFLQQLHQTIAATD